MKTVKLYWNCFLEMLADGCKPTTLFEYNKTKTTIIKK
jgi:hypothetical protein